MLRLKSKDLQVYNVTITGSILIDSKSFICHKNKENINRNLSILTTIRLLKIDFLNYVNFSTR